MSQNKNLFNFSPESISQFLFGAFIAFILNSTGTTITLSIFLGILGWFMLGWFTNTTKTSPQPPTVPSADGIDAGLKYWLFFLLGFSWLGYPALMSIILGGIGALAGGWTIAWWRSKEQTQTQLPVEVVEDVEGQQQQSTSRITRQQKRRASRRYRRVPGSFSFKFWGK
ncbi:hypothetical protein [Nostoc sp. CMAA1605]|uniref:hypothetical protein n=1 Tax=Nostoc sp. CMAA1605 TaxID=2055159 RepID=UPI001F3930E2|nr:hypothetical protein [Nostoc sp. CMAA1605]MCF4968169.1 hypothetical protein [Nostoc sp. CMAA1605]